MVDLSTSPPDSPDQPGRDRRSRQLPWARLTAVGLAAGFHLALLALMLSGSPIQAPRNPEPESPPFVTVMAPPPPKRADQKAGSPPRAASATLPAKPTQATKVVTPRRRRPPRAPPPPRMEPLVASTGPFEPDVVLGESDLAGATAAGTDGGTGGAGGGAGSGAGCDMVRRLQDALREDPEVTAAVTRSHRALGAGGKAILVWNGEWLRSPGQAGKGLAGVRQAIAMEVAFAPEACRAQIMRGLVVIAFNDRPDAPRLALGARQWRWTELLSARR